MRSFNRRTRKHLIRAAALAGLTAAPAWGVNYTWDPDGNFANGITPASGTWDSGSTQWQIAASDTIWSNGNLPVFSGGSGGDAAAETYAVTVGSSAFTATGVSIVNTGFLLTAATPIMLSLSGSQPVFSLAAGKSVSIGGNLNIQGGTTAMELTGGSTLSTYNVLSGASLTAPGAVRLNTGVLNVNGNVITGTNIILLQATSPTNAVINFNSGTMTSGSNTTNGDGIRFGSAGTGGTATFNLNGGTVSVVRVYESGTPTSTFNFNGGTLQARGNYANFMTGLDNAVIKSGGARIDSNGFNINLAQALTHDAALGATVDGGLTKLSTGGLTLTGASTYTGGTTIAAGTLALDLGTNSTGVLPSGTTVTLGGLSNGVRTNAAFTVTGKSTGSSAQTIGGLSLLSNTADTITLNPNNGTDTTLSIGSWTRNAGSTLFVDLSSANTGTRTVTANPTTSNGILGYGIVRDTTNYGFATVSGGNLVRLASADALTNSSSGLTTNYVYSGTGTLNHDVGNWAANSLELALTNSVTVNLNGTLTLSSGGLLYSRNGGTPVVASGQLGATDSEVMVHIFNTVGATTSLVISATVSSGTGSLVKTGGSYGTLVLTGSNSYTGNTVNQVGTLQIGNSGTSGSISSSSLVINNGNLSIARSDDVSFSNTITGSGTLTRSGGGKLTLGSNNTYTGQTLITGSSTIEVNALGNWSAGNVTPGELGSPTTASGGTIVLGSGSNGVGTLRYVGAGESTNRTIAIGNNPGGQNNPVGTIDASGTGALTISSVSLGATGTGSVASLVLSGTNTGTNTMAGLITNQAIVSRQLAKVTKSGAGTWVLTNDSNDFSSSNLNVAGGILVARGNVEASSFQNGTVTNSNATVTVTNATGLAVGDYVYGTESNADGRRVISSISGNDITLDTTVSGTSGVASLEFVSVAAQTSVFGSARSHLSLGSAATTTNNWSAAVQTDGAYDVARPITVGDFATSGTYSVGGRATSVSSFSGLITTNRSLSVTQVAGGTLNVTGGITGSSVASNGTQTVTFAGPGTINFATAGISDGSGGGTTKTAVAVSAGTTNFNIASTYTGGTTVTGGSLFVNNAIGSATGSGAVGVAAGARLGGGGTISGALNASGTITPGNSVGTLTSGQLTMAATGTLSIDFSTASNTADQLVVSSGGVALGGANLELVNLQNTHGPFQQNFVILRNDSGAATTGTFAGLADGSTFTYGNLVFTINYGVNAANSDGLANDVQIGFASVPEPASLGVIGLGGMGLLRRRRNRRAVSC